MQPRLVLASKLAIASLVGFACGNEPRESAPPAESEQVVTGRAPPAAGGLPSVITLEGQPSHGNPVPTEPAVMDQFGIAFVPNLLLVRAGQPVEFRNSEEVPHNVHVVETAANSTLLNVATMMGDPHDYTFERTGGYSVSCDLHPGMAAFILVVSTPYAVAAEDDGSFSLSDVPPGSYTLKVWNMDPARRSERTVEVGDGRTDLTLDAIQ